MHKNKYQMHSIDHLMNPNRHENIRTQKNIWNTIFQ